MPSIWNTSNVYSVNSNNNKRVASKLTFEVGERFTGRVVNKGEGNEVTIRLSDGWQFTAEVEGSLEGLENGNVKLQVEGHENGKLKLKLVSEGIVEEKEGSLESIILKEGLKKKDEALLKAMVKFNIPLTKENINKIRSLVQFADKINTNTEEIDKFIKSYLNSKEVGLTSQRGQEITNVLKGFLNEYKTLSKEDILFFLENNIEFSKEGIEGYKKLFKNNDESLNKFLNNIKGSMSEIIQEDGTAPTNELTKIIKDEKPNIVSDIKASTESIINNKVDNEAEEAIINSKQPLDEKIDKGSIIKHPLNAYENKEKVSILSVLKEIIKDTNNTRDAEMKDSLNKFLKENNIIEEDGLVNKDALTEIKKEVTSSINIKEIVGNENSKSGELVKELTSANNKADIQAKDIIEKVNNLIDEAVETEVEVAKEIIKATVEDKYSKLENSSKELIKQDIKNNIELIKDTVKELINNSKLNGEAGDKVFNLLKNNLSSFKLLNSVNNEYYYLDIPIKREEKEYPCKLIIKDDRKEGKKIDRNNVKMVVSVNTLNLGTVDGFLTFKDKKLQVDLKCNKNIIKIVNKEKEKLQESLNNLGFKVNISVLERIEEVSLTGCREFFSGNHKGLIDKKV